MSDETPPAASEEPTEAVPGEPVEAAQPAEPVAAQAGPPPPPFPPGRTGQRYRGGAFLAAPIATGLIGLMIGILIGGVGLGLVTAVVRHAHHGPGPGFRGDNRGHNWQDNRPQPRGPFNRPKLIPGVVPSPTHS